MRLDRRTFLRAAGVSLALPCLDALAPSRAQAATAKPRRRMVCICAPLGLYAANLFPETAGTDYRLTPYLDLLKDFRDDFTVISGLSHPEVPFGHDSYFSFLTAAPHPEQRAGFRNTISLDQFAAEHLAGETRFPSLPLGALLSWSRTGAPVPAYHSPSRLFARLFLEGRPDEVETQVRQLRDGRSILDAVGDQVRHVQRNLGAGDCDKLDQYLTSVRDLERGLARAEEWARVPKPQVDAQPPRDITNNADVVGRIRLMLDLTRLAFQTDSTRLVTISLGSPSDVPPIPGVSDGYHNLSHHGRDPEKLRQLTIVESEQLKVLGDFLRKLGQTTEEGDRLLDRTMVFLGSNLGNASNHSCQNLPVLLAGGGFRHGRHLAFDPDSNPPLSNLYLSMLQRLGIEADQFGSSTGTLTGLEGA